MIARVLYRTGYILMLATVFFAFPLSGADNQPPSFTPPAGLAVDSVPLFVIIGFDDNRYTDGMEWVLSILKDKKNPKGTGNPATFDDKPISVGFYFISSALDEGGEALLTTWKGAAAQGHEVGVHTITHNTSANTPLATWRSEISGCRTALSQKLAIPEETIVGFRTPYLAFNDATFTALSQEKLLFECTMTQMQDYNKSLFVWPYTLDSGFPDKVIIGWEGKCKVPGLWEIPVYTVAADATTFWPPVCGFDSSILPFNASIFPVGFKYGIDYRLKAGGNRAPITVGLHSDYYSEKNPECPNLNNYMPIAQRKAAVTDFINYALQKPMVRFVSPSQFISWMRKPVPLGRPPITAIAPTTIALQKAFTITKLRPAMIQLSVPKTDVYEIRVCTSSGRALIDNMQARCASGSNAIALKGNRLAAGAYLVTVTGAGLCATRMMPLEMK